MADPLNQNWQAPSDSDFQLQIAWSGPYDPSTVTWLSQLAPSKLATSPVAGVTPTVSVGTVTVASGVYSATIAISISQAQINTLAVSSPYWLNLFRADAGNKRPSTAGTLTIFPVGPGP